MSNAHKYPFNELPIEEILDAIAIKYPEINIDIDDLKNQLARRKLEPTIEIKPKAIRLSGDDYRRVALPTIGNDQPWNMKNTDHNSMQHLDTIWSAVNEVAANTQAPGDMILICALAACAAVAQGLYQVRSPSGGVHPLSLNTIVIAESGERKTTVDRKISQAINDIISLANEKIEMQNQGHEIRQEIWENTRSALKSQCKTAQKNGGGSWETADYATHLKSKPKKTSPLYFVHYDFTPGALIKSLDSNIPVASIMTSEAGKILSNSNMEFTSLLNALWDGSTVNTIRLTRGNHQVSNARLSMSLMIQPEILRRIMDKRSNELRDSGFLARALICSPESTIGRRHIYSTNNPSEKIDALNNRIAEMMVELLVSLIDRSFSRHELSLDQAAERLWLNFANEVEGQINPGGAYTEAKDHASKLAENVLRTAGVLHAVEFGQGKISAETLHAAIIICGKCSRHFVNWFVPRPQAELNGQRINKYLNENYVCYLTNRPAGTIYFHDRFIPKNRILQCGPLSNAEELNQALGWLHKNRLIGIYKEIRPKGKGTTYIDLMPNAQTHYISAEGFPLQRVNLQ